MAIDMSKMAAKKQALENRGNGSKGNFGAQMTERLRFVFSPQRTETPSRSSSSIIT